MTPIPRADAGGTAGTSGAQDDAGGASGTGGSNAASLGECETAADCELVGDCCNCASIAVGQADGTPSCLAACERDRCTELGVSAQCVLGRCVFDASCHDARATCKATPPTCPAGQAALVQDGCYGACVDVRECVGVRDCDACGSDQACVGVSMLSSIDGKHCFDLPSACAGSPSCECMGDDICPVACGEGKSGGASDDEDLACFCLAC